MTKIYSKWKGGVDIFGNDNSIAIKPKEFESFYSPEEMANMGEIKKSPKVESRLILPDTSIRTTYNDLEWEYGRCATSHYDESLRRIDSVRIKNAHNSYRHPYPWEMFGLIFDGLEGKLSGNWKYLYSDIMKSPGGWFCMAFERRGHELHAYSDPENLKFNGSIYEAVGGKLRYSKKEVFDIKGIASQSLKKLNTFPEEFVKYMYGRKFDELPNGMMEGSRIKVSLPQEGEILPVGRGCFDGRFDIYGCSFNLRSSRWVREIK